MSCIVCFKNHDRIVLACDSRGQSADAESSTIRQHRSEHKGIRESGRWVLTLAGFSRGPDVPDVRAVLGGAIAQTDTIAAAVQAMTQAFTQTVFPALEAASDYPAFDRLFESLDGSVLDVVVAGRDGAGRLALGCFGAAVTTRHPFACRMYGGPLGDDGPLWLSTGQQFAADLMHADPKPDWLQRADQAAARRVLELQSEETPDCVSEPFHVWEMTA